MNGKGEKVHEGGCRKFKGNLESNEDFDKEEEVEWQRRKCGFVIKGKKAHQKCPACKHPQAYFEEQKNNN